MQFSVFKVLGVQGANLILQLVPAQKISTTGMPVWLHELSSDSIVFLTGDL